MTTATAQSFHLDAVAAAPAGPRFRLSVMMFLEFFIWGAWLPLIFGYLPDLKFTASEQSWVVNAFALASFVGMFFSNQFADRNFAAQRFLAVSHLIGGIAILALGWVTTFWPFFLLMLLHCLFYVPTISITNSIAFANLKDPKRDFGRVRLWGTIGWIAASWPFVFLLTEWSKVPGFGSVPFTEWFGKALSTSKTGSALTLATSYTFIAAGIASLLLAAFSLSLPHTPPKPAKAGEEKFAWLEAIKLLKVPFILVLFIVTFFDAAVHTCYFFWTGRFLQSVGVPANWVMPAMSIGQIAEIGTMAILGLVLKRLGWRTTMVVGILGHAVRFGMFALAPMPAVAITMNVLHGICYAFFFATVYIFVDEFFPKDARSSAQGLFNFLILGFGPFVANFVWAAVGEASKVPVRFDAPAPAAITASVANDYRLVDIYGKAGPNEKFGLALKDGKKDGSPNAMQADAEGNWKLSTQFLSQSGDGRYQVMIVPAEGGPAIPSATITGIERVDFRKLFLAPSATAFGAALLLLLFFRPPETAKRREDGGAVATPH
jgi:nucleoside transporter